MAEDKPRRRYALVEILRSTQVDGYVDYPQGWTDEELELVVEYYQREIFDELESSALEETETTVIPPEDYEPDEEQHRPGGPVTVPFDSTHLLAAREWKARRDAERAQRAGEEE